jgi:hypothetical protein
MTLIALKLNRVVSIEKDGAFDVSMEHDVIVSVPDNSNPKMGWTYSKPPKVFDGVIYFYPENPSYFDHIEKEQSISFIVDAEDVQSILQN